MIVFSILVAAQTSQSVVELMHCPISSDFLMTPQTEYFDVRTIDDRGCFASLGVRAAAGLAQWKHRQRDDRQKCDGWLKTIFAGELESFGPAASLHVFVVLFQQPTKHSTDTRQSVTDVTKPNRY